MNSRIPIGTGAGDTTVPAAQPLPDSVPGGQSIQAVEEALVALLRARPALAIFQIEAWPEDVGTYKLRSKHGALLVSYKGSKFGKNLSTDGMTQEWTLEFEVVTLCRNLRSHVGAYLILDEIRRAITGWWAPGSIDNAFPTREGFIGEDDGVWQYASYFSIPSVNVQDDNTDQTVHGCGGTLQSVTPYLEEIP